MSEQNPWSLVGCGVHKYTRKDGKDFVQKQGHVVMVKNDLILIQWFSWISGEPIYAHWYELISFTDDEEWAFFENVDDMREYYIENKQSIGP